MSQSEIKLEVPTALVTLFLLSFAVLTVEVAYTRIFSVILSNHFVFALVSTALFGLGTGGLIYKKWGEAIPEWARRNLPAFFGVLVVVVSLLIAVLPLNSFEAMAGSVFWIYLVLAVLPFGVAGWVIAEIFQEQAGLGPWLYGADLAGAALGALSVVPLMDLVGGFNVIFLAAFAAAIAGLAWSWRRIRVPVFALGTCLATGAMVLLLALVGFQVMIPIAKDPDKDMYRLLANPAYKASVVESRWSSFGRTDLVKTPLLPNEMTLYVDGAAGSVMYNVSQVLKDPQESAHLTLHFGAYFPFLLMSPEQKRTALSIGPGGGRDVVVALLGGVKSVTAVEVNPDVVQIVKDYRSFNGGIYSDIPQVKAVVAEGRNFVRNSQQNYDIMMLSIPITKSSRSVDGFALTENYLFTTEAFEDYLNHLTLDGRIIIVAHNAAEIYRIAVMAAAAFAKQGLSEPEALKHIYTIASGMMPAIVIQKQALTPDQATAIHSMMHKLGFDKDPFYVPFIAQTGVKPGEQLGVDQEFKMFDQFLVKASQGSLSLDTLIKSATLEIGPVSDDRPFFYKFTPGLPERFGVFAVLIVLALAGLLFLLGLRPSAGKTAEGFLGALRTNPVLKRYLAIFVLLGSGFMIIEIALFQKLILFLGKPQQALGTLLFALLLGGGIGSFASSFLGKYDGRKLAGISLGVSGLVVALSLTFAYWFSGGLAPELIATLLLVPLGCLMGFLFPVCVKRLDSLGLAKMIPVMWGANGIASVLGSALAMIIGIMLGFSLALWIAAAMYALVAALLFLNQGLSSE